MPKHKANISPELLASATGLIYEAAHQPEHWPELINTLENICASTKYLQAHENLFDSHFQRALNINQHLQHLEQSSQVTSSIINQLPIGIITAGSNASVHTINNCAERVLQLHDNLFVRDGKLVCASKRQTKQLHQMIQDCISGESSQAGSSIQIQNTQKSEAISLWVQPFTSTDNQAFSAVYIASPKVRPECGIHCIQEAFGLTQAEAKLVKKITNGCNNLNEAAASLNISIHTARTQIKKVFEKTSTSNQLELVKKVLTSPEIMLADHDTPPSSRKKVHKASCIKLFDGRTLAYSEYGDPNGTPVLFFHSIVGGELECDYKPEILMEHGIRLIAPSRPGFGQSTQYSKHSALQFAQDIQQLLEQLDIQSCAILSYSLGSFYGFACCSQMPDIIQHHSIVSPPGLRPSKRKITQATNIPFFRVFTSLAITAPRLLTTSIRMTYKLFSYDIESFWDKTSPYLCECDKEEIIQHKTKLKQAFQQGNQQAGYQAAQEMILWVKPWGFKPEDITTPSTIWHGEKDKFTSPTISQDMVKHLQHSELKLIKDGGHYILYKQWESILCNLSKSLQSS